MYPKFHCELNYIKHFWVYTKQYTWDHCDYILEGLYKKVLKTLVNIKSHTILGYYTSCFKKPDLYWQGIGYAIEEWQTLSSYQKPQSNGDDC